MGRVIVYIDGFNLYHGLRASGWQRYYWLNIQALAQDLTLSTDTLVKTKYFTARLDKPPDKVKRQTTYIEALETLPSDFEIHFGRYDTHPRTCRKCGYTWPDSKEKKTDVNIATELLVDAFQDNFDTAYIISADGDICPAIDAVNKVATGKRIVAAFPPGRSSHDMVAACSAYLKIRRTSLARSQFPDKVVKPDGFVLERPVSWR
jgi:uncharacterized LabA/DUF88 family protein